MHLRKIQDTYRTFGGILGTMEGLRNGDTLKTEMGIVTVMGKLQADQVFVIKD